MLKLKNFVYLVGSAATTATVAVAAVQGSADAFYAAIVIFIGFCLTLWVIDNVG